MASKTSSFQIRLEPDVHKAAKAAAALMGLSVSAYIARLILAALEREAS